MLYHIGPETSEHPGGWYLITEGLSGDRAADLRLMDLLNGWADEIEDNLKVMAPGEMPEVEQLITWLSKLKSAN